MDINLENGLVYDPAKGVFNKRDLVVKNAIIGNVDDNVKSHNINGYYVYPGLVDSHLHLVATGRRQLTPSLDDIKGKNELDLLLKRFSNKNLVSSIFNARGWDQDKLGFMPDRNYLDNIFPETPAILERRCGHVAIVNSTMIDLYNLKELDGLDGTCISRGYLKERALIKLQNLITLSNEELNTFLNKGIELLLKYGITNIHTDDLHGVELETLIRMLSAQKKIRIFEKLNVPFSQIEKIKNFKLYENEFLKLGSVKIFLDGSFGARTGALMEPYADDKDNKGLLYYSEEELKKILTLCEKEKLQLSVHIIGDRALKIALNAFSNYPNSSLKHRLIHLQVASDNQIEWMAEIGLIASLQPVFYTSDNAMALARLGEARFKKIAYPFKKMLESGISISLSTDSPVEDPNPFLNIIAADKFFDRKTTLYLYMINGRSHGFSNDSGRLLSGERADFFITTTNLIEASKKELKTTEVKATVVNGELVHGSLP
ncbi:MAG: amidohydrolase [Kosmotogaceae bacterium]